MKVLYLEDNRLDADLAVRELRRVAPDIDLSIVGTIAAAMGRLDEWAGAVERGEPGDFEILLLDRDLPDGDGLTVLSQVRHRGLRLAVVVLTGSGDEEGVLMALRAGADDYVAKRHGFWDQLPATLRASLERFRSQVVREMRPLSLLYVEPNGNDVELTRHHLGRFAPHLHLETFSAAAQVLARLPEAGRVRDVDVLLVDYRLPGMDALELLKEVRHVRALDIPVILITGQGSEEVALQAMRLGAADYLVKSPGYLYRLAPAVESAFYRAEALRDLAERRRAEHRLGRLNRVYSVLSAINQTIVRERDPLRMIAEACRIAVEKGGVRLAWVGLREEGSGLHRIAGEAAAAGEALVWLRGVLANGTALAVTDQVVRTGIQEVCNNFAEDPRMDRWRDDLRRLGFASQVSLPIREGEALIGTLNLFSDETGFFDEEELLLLGELAMDVAFAVEVSRRDEDRLRADAALRRSEERFRTLIENASDLITVINHQGIIRFQSPASERMLNLKPEEMIERSAFEYIHPEDTPGVMAAIQRAVAKPLNPVSVRFRMRRRDGSWCETESIGRSLPDEADDGYFVVNSRDVTDRKVLEEQLRQSQKMEAFGQLAGGVAHDFNNLLTVIQGMLSLLEGDPRFDPGLEEFTRAIGQSSDRAANLTRQLLTFSRRQALQLRDLDLNEIVGNTTGMLRRILGEDIQTEVRCAPGPLAVHADAGMLDQVLLNLAVNARDAMPRGGRLSIGTAEVEIDEGQAAGNPGAYPGHFSCLTVSDTGSGIPPQVLPHIFEPFYTTKEVGKGTGLGLATVYGIVLQHRGWIDVRSVPGEGACFRVYFPALRRPVAPPAPAGYAAGQAGGSETILVVEDALELRQLIRRVLEESGYSVILASSGAEALVLWPGNRDRIDLLLTDVVMPDGVSGLQLARQLLGERAGLKVIYSSGYSSDLLSREPGIEDGPTVLPKPYHVQDLLRTIRQCLDRP